MKLKRLFIFVLVLPVALGLWVVGWTMSWAGSREEKDRQKKVVKE
jgi:uncharacterized membrane protein